MARLDAEAAAQGTSWSAMHVRHGDRQYTSMQLSPQKLLDATAGWLGGGEATEAELLYVATDEPRLDWFQPLEGRHRLRFLKDFPGEVAGLPNDLLGMVEQVVLAHGRTFTGTWFSTFSAYACRLRGYYGRFPESSCYVYAPANKRMDFQQWKMPGWEALSSATKFLFPPSLFPPTHFFGVISLRTFACAPRTPGTCALGRTNYPPSST